MRRYRAIAPTHPPAAAAPRDIAAAVGRPQHATQ